MGWPLDTTQVVVTAAACTIQIVFRSGYRILSMLKVIDSPIQKWNADDSWMTISFLPLAARTVCVAWFFTLDPHSTDDDLLSTRLLISARLFYALFLWCMKYCLLEFYARLATGSNKVHLAIQILRFFIATTFMTVIATTLVECESFPSPPSSSPEENICRIGKGNLIALATLSLATDIALIVFPIPMLWKMTRLDFQAKLQLTLLFLAGVFLVIITIIRVPVIFGEALVQTSRSLWASVEIICSSLVANAAFYYALCKVSSKRRHCILRSPRPSSPAIMNYGL